MDVCFFGFVLFFIGWGNCGDQYDFLVVCVVLILLESFGQVFFINNVDWIFVNFGEFFYINYFNSNGINIIVVK